jgi:ABC-type phosphate transport system substrate-binding protein
MFTRGTASLLVIAALALGVVALPAQAALRHIDGTVVSKNAAEHSFRIKTQGGNRIRIKVNGSTRFQRIAGGFGGLHKGLVVEVEAKGTSNGLVATQVETRGGGASGGGGGADDTGAGHHGGGADDGPAHA